MPTNEMTHLAGSMYGAGLETVRFSLYDIANECHGRHWYHEHVSDTSIDSDAYTDTLISSPLLFEVDFVARIVEDDIMASPEGDI